MNDEGMGDAPFDDRIAPTKRIKPRPKVGLQVSEVKAMERGNYIFSFGFPGSGKTTFQWMLMNYLMNEGPFRTEITIPDRSEGADWEGRSIINAWKNLWIEGRFPARNPVDEKDIREIQVKTSTISGKKLSLDFSFLEVSGELLQAVLPAPSSPPNLAPLLRAYLGNPRLKFCVLLMLSPNVEENDQLFASFIAYVKKSFPGLLERMSLGVIISRPEESLQRLQEFGATDGETGFTTFNEDALLAYMNRFCGETYQIWSDWPDANKTLLSPMALGDIEMVDGESRLIEPDFRHVEQVFFWMFKQLNGVEPGPTLWQKMTGQLDWK